MIQTTVELGYNGHGQDLISSVPDNFFGPDGQKSLKYRHIYQILVISDENFGSERYDIPEAHYHK